MSITACTLKQLKKKSPILAHLMGRNETQMESLNHQDLKLVLEISAGYTLGASVWVTGGKVF